MVAHTTTDRLFEAAYDDLCRIARRMRGSTAIPDPAALVHEAYLRFRNRRFGNGNGSERLDEFIFVMALALKTVARDRRRRETARKRGGGRIVVALDDLGPHEGRRTFSYTRTDVRALRELLQRLAQDCPEWFAVLLHHDFAGRTIRETAQRMGVDAAYVRSCRRSALRVLRIALGRNRNGSHRCGSDGNGAMGT